MNKYEVMFIVKPDMEESVIKAEAEKLKKVLADNGSKILEEKVMGQRELAYEIKKYSKGYYFLYIVEAPIDAVNEFDRVVLINETILRHLVIRKED